MSQVGTADCQLETLLKDTAAALAHAASIPWEPWAAMSSWSPSYPGLWSCLSVGWTQQLGFCWNGSEGQRVQRVHLPGEAV